MTTQPVQAKSIEHPCLNCGREPRVEVAGILGVRCQAKVAKTWRMKPDRQNPVAAREDRIGALYREHLRGKRGPVRYGPNGGVR
jgi:hypothetical protein